MNQFWVDMIMQGKAKFDDIKGTARKNAVKKIFDQYLANGVIEQVDYNIYLGIETEEETEE